MKSTTNVQDSSTLSVKFLEQYSMEETIRKYTRKTAGHGISYLLDHEYGRIYLESIKRYVPKSRLKMGIRLWEFGCGGGMNLLHLVSLLRRQGIKLDLACGTDFSGALIAAAKREANEYMAVDQINHVQFTVAHNEDLIEGGARGLGLDRDDLLGSFDLVFGVNTIRYSHRLNNVDRCVEGIWGLLREGGVCIIIDMNCKFPAFRSRLRERPRKGDKSTFLPTLDEYARPFSSAGFEVLKKENFCWVPHSAGSQLTVVMRALTPILNTVAPSRGMRSLVICRKVSQVSRVACA
jgi:SAM-dependent methyltransferase